MHLNTQSEHRPVYNCSLRLHLRSSEINIKINDKALQIRIVWHNLKKVSQQEILLQLMSNYKLPFQRNNLLCYRDSILYMMICLLFPFRYRKMNINHPQLKVFDNCNCKSGTAHKKTTNHSFILKLHTHQVDLSAYNYGEIYKEQV